MLRKNTCGTEKGNSGNVSRQELENAESEEYIGEDILYSGDFNDFESDRLREAEVAYGTKRVQGEYTLEDYYALPDDVRAELIDGVIYDMAAPIFNHQTIVARLTVAFIRYIDEKHGKCKAVPGPVDVQLDCDDRTMVQPDLLILCNMDQIKNGVVYGAPDLVVEVLSPATEKKDRTIKLRKYREAGVREYWMIDLQREEIEVYFFRNPELMTLPRVYGFKDVISVGIYDGDCKVDFADVSRWV